MVFLVGGHGVQGPVPVEVFEEDVVRPDAPTEAVGRPGAKRAAALAQADRDRRPPGLGLTNPIVRRDGVQQPVAVDVAQGEGFGHRAGVEARLVDERAVRPAQEHGAPGGHQVQHQVAVEICKRHVVVSIVPFIRRPSRRKRPLAVV